MMIEFEDHSRENQDAMLRYLAGERVAARPRPLDVLLAAAGIVLCLAPYVLLAVAALR